MSTSRSTLKLYPPALETVSQCNKSVIPGEQNDMGRDPWFDRPFDKLTVLSKVEGLTVLGKVEGLTILSVVDPSTWLRVDAEQGRSIEGESRKLAENQIIRDPPPKAAGDDELRHALEG